MSSYVKGKFKRNIFQAESGYTIGLFKVEEAENTLEDFIKKTISFTGYFHDLNDTDTYIFYGSMIEHPKYGKQFEVESYERIKPEDKDSIVSFLCSDIFKGIGENKAKKIVKVLGKETISTILENPNNLILIPGVTEKDIQILHDGILEHENTYEIIIKLTDLGFTTKEAMKIQSKYRESALQVIEENIYKLVEDLEKFSFKRIDYIAINNGIEKEDINRIGAAILYVMEEVSNSLGHSYYYIEELISMLPRVLNTQISEEKILEIMNNLILDLKIVKQGNKYYTRTMYDAEILIVNRVNILNHEKDNKLNNIEEQIKKLESFFEMEYNEEQKNAILNSYLKHFLIVTGGPGTGKTTIMKAIVELYRQAKNISYDLLKEKIALLAPTGRASKRMSEATNMPSSTIHRFLKWNKDTNKFQVNEYSKSNVEFVVIDEASMIDTYLFSNLLKGLKVNTKIILVGDVDQLPSVGPGQVLYDLITSEKVNICRLSTLYRQESGSNITHLAYDIKDGNIDFTLFNKEADLTFIECDKSEVLYNMNKIASAYLDYSHKNFQILAPMYKTENGIDAINRTLQELFNPPKALKKEIQIGEETYREGDKVIQLANMPEENVYNGDIGIIKKIKVRPKKEVYIDFEENLVKYTPSNFLNFKKAYAISIHKAQGSEFDVVILPFVKSFNKMLYRKLIYTALTRCKKNFYLVGEKNALKMAVNSMKMDLRRTSIKKYLIEGIK